jgi:VWFA-related protein
MRLGLGHRTSVRTTSGGTPMGPSTRRRFGIRDAFPVALATLLVLTLEVDSVAQQTSDANILQTPQVFRSTAPPAINVISVPQMDPEGLVRIPVTVIDDAGRCVEALSARDFSLSVDGEESPIAMFRPNHATAAALGVLVDVSQAMSYKSWRGGVVSKVPLAQEAIATIIDKLDPHDNVFMAAFARRFHMLDDFTTDHRDLKERLPMLRPTDLLDDFDGNGIYESMIKGITVLTHAPKACDRRALLVVTSAFCDTSTHGTEDVIAKAQFAGVTVYNIIVLGFRHESDLFSIRNGIGRIASETGGLTFIVNGRGEGDPVDSATGEIVSELDNQYVLGFAVPQWGSNVLPVELMLPHHPGMRVRAPRVVRFRLADLKRRSASPLPPDLPE